MKGRDEYNGKIEIACGLKIIKSKRSIYCHNFLPPEVGFGSEGGLDWVGTKFEMVVGIPLISKKMFYQKNN